MNKLISAVAAVVLAGCGLAPVDEPGSPVAYEPPTTLEARHPSRILPEIAPAEARREPVAVRERVEPKGVDVTLKLTRVPGEDAKELRVLLGQSGCGFWTMGEGVANVNHGVAQLTFPGLPAHLAGVDVLVFRDVDGDGRCTGADTVWQGTISTDSFNSLVTLDLNQLEQAAEWTCWMFTTR